MKQKEAKARGLCTTVHECEMQMVNAMQQTEEQNQASEDGRPRETKTDETDVQDTRHWGNNA